MPLRRNDDELAHLLKIVDIVTVRLRLEGRSFH